VGPDSLGYREVVQDRNKLISPGITNEICVKNILKLASYLQSDIKVVLQKLVKNLAYLICSVGAVPSYLNC
jgi:hypothetical protein